MKENEYQCAMCGGIFGKGWSDKAAWREYDDNFLKESRKTAKILCDDCYRKMIAIEPPPGMKEQQETDALKLAQMAAFPPVAIEQQTDYDWFHLKLNKPWWWKLLHPIKTRTIKKWMRETEPVMKQELEKMNFNKMIKKMLYDQICYGTSAVHIGTYGISPAQVAMKDIKLMNEVRGVWRKMDIINTHKDIIETEIKRKEKP